MPSPSDRVRARWRVVPTLAPLLALLSAVLTGTAPAGEATRAPSWRDAAALEKVFEEICGDVESVCEASFAPRPAVRGVSVPEMAEILRTSGWTGPSEDPFVARPEDEAAAWARTILGFCPPGGREVDVVRGNVDRRLGWDATPAQAEEDVQVLLAHEATHALDYQRFGLDRRDEACSDLEAHWVLWCLAEGHADWVAEQVAGRRGFPEAFGRMVERRAEAPEAPPSEETAWRGPTHLDPGVPVRYRLGHAFLREVAAARGRAGIERVLQWPPADTRAIERPGEWLRGGPPAGEPDLREVLGVVRWICVGPAWVVDVWRPCAHGLDDAWPTADAGDPGGRWKGYVDAWRMWARVPGDDAGVTAMVVLFEDEEGARALVRAGASSAKEATEGPTPGAPPSDAPPVEATPPRGAGTAGRYPGRAGRSESPTTADDGGPMVREMQEAALGRVAVSIDVIGVPSFDRETQDEVLARMDLRVRDPVAARGLPPLRALAYARRNRTLAVRVLDPDGRPVPHAEVWVHSVTRDIGGEVEAGQAVLVVPACVATVDVWAARGADGAPLPLAPASRLAVAAEAGEVTVRLAAGLEITGTVVDGAGRPMAGALVVAEAKGIPGFEGQTGPFHGSDATAADGSFRIVGLGPFAYRVEVFPSSGGAVPPGAYAPGGATGVRIVCPD